MISGIEWQDIANITRLFGAADDTPGKLDTDSDVPERDGVSIRKRREANPPRELALVGGSVVTVDHRNARADAVLLRGKRIESVGSRDQILSEARTDTMVIDLAGRTVVPGFIDAHLHLTALGARERALDLDSLTKAEILDALTDRADSLEPGELLVAYDWDFTSCPDPHRSDLDALFPDRPVVLFQFSGHGGWVNTQALELLGVTPERADWQGGGAERDANGELTGVLREPRMAPGARRVLGKQTLSRKTVRSDLESAMIRLAENGITSVHDNTWYPWVLDEIRRLHARGNQTARVSCWSPGFIRALDRWFSLKRCGEWYARGPRKYFLDGAFSSHSAWLTEPYADRIDANGDGYDPTTIARFLRRANRQGRQLACHAIGDAAVAAYLDAVEATGADAAAALRHRIEHGQLIREVDIDRIAQYGMIVSAQPHAAGDRDKDIALLGERRADLAYPYRSLLDAGVAVAFGSDFPGERTYNPLYGIHLAVNRQGGEAITAEEALSCYTAGGAWAEFAEDEKGRIRRGYLADLAILSADPTRIDPRDIHEIAVDATIVDGRVVYERTGCGLGNTGEAGRVRTLESSR